MDEKKSSKKKIILIVGGVIGGFVGICALGFVALVVYYLVTPTVITDSKLFDVDISTSEENVILSVKNKTDGHDFIGIESVVIDGKTYMLNERNCHPSSAIASDYRFITIYRNDNNKFYNSDKNDDKYVYKLITQSTSTEESVLIFIDVDGEKNNEELYKKIKIYFKERDWDGTPEKRYAYLR